MIGDDRFDPWRRWDLQFPVNGGTPGEAPLPTTGDVLLSLCQLALHILLGARAVRWFQRWWLAGRGRSRDRTAQSARPSARDVEGNGGDWFVRRVILPGCLVVLDNQHPFGRSVQSLGRAVQRLLHASEHAVLALSPGRFPPRLWTALDLVLATIRGICRDRVLFRQDGYQRLDRVELRAWLRHHGARRHTLHSPLARVVYEATFQGFFTEKVAAGAALRILVWMTFTYKGAMYYKMKGGTGDVLNLPLYLLLRQRGVKFQFFTKVLRMRPGFDENGAPVIAAIDIERLARPLSPDGYDPLIEVGGTPCWPSAPIHDRLRPEDRDDAEHAEEYFHARAAPDLARIERGLHFDKVVFGIPVACIPFVCEELVDSGRGSWARQEQVATTQTVALQMWCDEQLADLGWGDPTPLLSLFWDPLNTWCDMSQVLPLEAWPTEARPRMLAYFCGPMAHVWPGPEHQRRDREFDRRWRAELDRQAQEARAELYRRIHQLWPGARGLRPRREYLRANYDPHARCTLALPRQAANRIAADDTGYHNLTVAGDWTSNYIQVACLEGTVQSGIRAARVISEQPALYRMIGESFLNPGPAVAVHPPARPGRGRGILGRFAPGRASTVTPSNSSPRRVRTARGADRSGNGQTRPARSRDRLRDARRRRRLPAAKSGRDRGGARGPFRRVRAQ